MREGIHPEYHKVQATCVCGGVIETGSVLPEIRLDICSACHPFYTGTQKIVDTEGRVEKFKKRFANAAPGAKKGGKAKPEKAPVAVAEAVAEQSVATEQPAAEQSAEAETSSETPAEA